MKNEKVKIKSRAAKPRTGTREWSKHSVNIQLGCENGCRYCYARHSAVVWLKKCTAEQWLNPVINQAAVDKDYVSRNGVTMFPTAHDITPANISECLVVINKLLEAGNKVLIVSKPRFSCIAVICQSIKSFMPNFFQDLVTFRFTIGSTDSEVLRFWEPGAPDFLERHKCLRYAYDLGFDTSVSIEPFLDAHPDYVYQAVEDFVTGEIWLGILRNFERRVVMDGVKEEQRIRYVDPIRKLVNSENEIMSIYDLMNGWPKVKWKDSIRKIISKGFNNENDSGDL